MKKEEKVTLPATGDVAPPVMTQESLRKALQERAEYLEKVRTLCKKSTDAPTGYSLHIMKSKNYTQYYRYSPERKREYISKKKLSEIQKYAQDEYDRKLLTSVSKEIDEIHALLDYLDVHSSEHIFQDLDSRRKELVFSRLTNRLRYVDQWMLEKSEYINTYDKGDGNFTMHGDHVRSKSEVIISDRLEKYDIPFKYEYPLVLRKGVVIYPDFTILHPKTLITCYYEHFGMIDIPEYAEAMNRKLALYAQHGIYPGKKLLMSFETKESPLDVRYVDGLLKHFLLTL